MTASTPRESNAVPSADVPSATGLRVHARSQPPIFRPQRVDLVLEASADVLRLCHLVPRLALAEGLRRGAALGWPRRLELAKAGYRPELAGPGAPRRDGVHAAPEFASRRSDRGPGAGNQQSLPEGAFSSVALYRMSFFKRFSRPGRGFSSVSE